MFSLLSSFFAWLPLIPRILVIFLLGFAVVNAVILLIIKIKQLILLG